jgi:hypothetical protein
MLTVTAVSDALAEALQDMTGAERFTEWLTLEDGSRVRAKLELDFHTGIEDYTDCYGKVAEDEGKGRPVGFDGAARKVRSRSGMLWWQPPEDVKGDPDALARVQDRVSGYFGEHWSFVGVVVERQGPACQHCGCQKTEDASLWGIESDVDAGYLAEVLRDLITEAEPK